MSYCRFAWGGSDVYVYESERGIECCGCRLLNEFVVDASEPEAMIAHLVAHRRAGHFVPEYAITALWDDVPGATVRVKPEPEGIAKAQAITAEVLRGLRAVRPLQRGEAEHWAHRICRAMDGPLHTMLGQRYTTAHYDAGVTLIADALMQASERPPSLAAVDPSVANQGTPSTRA